MSKTILCLVLMAMQIIVAVNSQIIWNGNWALGCDFRGNDIEQRWTTSDQCGPVCERHPRCTHFVWNAGNCFLKGVRFHPGMREGLKRTAFEIADKRVVCGTWN